MGSGILLLTAVEMTNLSLKPENKDKTFVLNAMDLSDAGLHGLMKYVKSQVLKIAEKQTVWLRSAYANREDLIENGEIIYNNHSGTFKESKRVLVAGHGNIPATIGYADYIKQLEDFIRQEY